MRKDLEDWLRGSEHPRPMTLVSAHRTFVVPDGASGWNLPVAFLSDLPVVHLPLAIESKTEQKIAEQTTERELPIEREIEENGRETAPEEPLEEAEAAGLDGGADSAGDGIEEDDLEEDDLEEDGIEDDDLEKSEGGESAGPVDVDAAERVFEFEPAAGNPAAEESAGLTDSAGDASGEEQEDAADAENENAGREGDYVVPESYRRRRSEMRFEERLKRLELSRQPASPWGSGFRAKYGRFAAAGVAVFLIAGTIFLTYNHLRRNSYGFLMENAKMLYDRRMYEESLRAYREVSLMYPDRVDPFLGVALASERTGRFEEAIEAYKCVLDLEPFYNFAQDELTRISRVSEEAGKEEDGEENFSAGGDADAQKYDHAVQMGKIALLEGSYGEASRHFSDALALYSDDAGVWVSFADARAGSGDIGGAIESLQTALSKDPANEEAKSRLAGIEKSAAEKEALEKKTIQKKKSPPAKAKTMRRTKSRRTSSSSQSSIESPGL